MVQSSPLEILQSRFGYNSFRLEQESIINTVLSGKDSFVLMPTGGGKSLCYQIPALMFEGLTLVVSPLIALMKDQVDALRVNGIAAAYLNSSLSFHEQEEIMRNVHSRELKLLYVAPEKLLGTNGSFLNELVACNISLIAIDEAHCISEWGHDFRPEYRMLAQLKKALPKTPVIALTATADRVTQKDILEKLELKNPVTFVSSFNRANIRYSVEEKRNSFQKLLTFLENKKDDAGIIYCLSRNSTESLAQDLVSQGYAALPYHAGLEKETRARHQELFLRDEVKIIVATIAFGMGIDKSNVRYVVHMDLPKSIENYYQETGRAGRDGLISDALLLYSYADVSKLKAFIKDESEHAEISLKKLDQMARYGESSLCRRKYLLNYFDEQAPEICGNCDTCLTNFEQEDATMPAQKILSAVSRLQERYGAGYVIDFLRGADSVKIQEYHKQLKTFGIGSETSKDEWSHFIKELVAREYLVKSEGSYPVLKLSALSAAVLRGERKVMLPVNRGRKEIKDTALAYEAPLFNQLKTLRRAMAERERVAPYIILSDATLIELSTYFPQDKSELSTITGFGQVKLERYGMEFLEIVSDYTKKNRLSSRMSLKAPRRQRIDRPQRDSDTKQQSLELFKKGNSIETIAASRKFSTATIEGHLAFYVETGELQVEQLMDLEKVPAILAAIEKSGGKLLTPVKEILGEGYSYLDIKLVMGMKS